MMSEQMERIRSEVLGLSISERAELAELLIESLDNEEPSDDLAEVERAWLQKVRSRIDDVDGGRVETIPAKDVLAEARRLHG